MPSFSRTAARITEPTVGASVWASGSQVWNGNIGTLMAKPMNRPPKISTWVPWGSDAALWISVGMSKVLPALKYRARKLRIISAEPNSVKRKNLIDAYCRLGPPHTPIMKYIGQQDQLEEDEEQDQVLGQEGPGHAHLEDEHERQERLGVVGLREVVPAVDDAQRDDEQAQAHQRQREPVDAHVVPGVDDVDPVAVDHESAGSPVWS